MEGPEITAPDLLRSLVPEYREILLASEVELRERLPADLPLILRLDEWYHPEATAYDAWYNPNVTADQFPSGNSTILDAWGCPGRGKRRAVPTGGQAEHALVKLAVW